MKREGKGDRSLRGLARPHCSLGRLRAQDGKNTSNTLGGLPRLHKKSWSLEISLGHCLLLQTPGLGRACVWSYMGTYRRSEPLATGSCSQPSIGPHTHTRWCTQKQDCVSHPLTATAIASVPIAPPLQPHPLQLQPYPLEPTAPFPAVLVHWLSEPDKPQASPQQKRQSKNGAVTTDNEELVRSTETKKSRLGTRLLLVP
jgi:hypothetical protein